MSNKIFTIVDNQPVYLPGEVSREILLMLDGDSLHQARQVCRGWNEAVLNLVWGEDRVAVERKLENNWRLAQPVRIERTFKLEGFEGALVSFTQNRAVMFKMGDLDDEERGDNDEKRRKCTFVEFNTKDGKVISANDFAVRTSNLGGGHKSVDEIENTVVVLVPCSDFEFGGSHVLAYNLQTHQITFDKVYETQMEELGEYEAPHVVVNETTNEIQYGMLKFKFTKDDIIEKTVYLPDNLGIVALHSDLCIKSTFEDQDEELKKILYKSDGNKYKRVGILDTEEKYYQFKFYADTSRIVSVSSRLITSPRALPFAVSLWNSHSGNLIKEIPLSHPAFITSGDIRRADLVKFQIEGNRLVLLLRENVFHQEGDNQYVDYQYHILIYELDKVLVGEETKPREFSLVGDLDNGDYFVKLLVDKTSVTAASKRGSVVKFDFWRC